MCPCVLKSRRLRAWKVGKVCTNTDQKVLGMIGVNVEWVKAVIDMRCRELGNYLTKCLDIPAVADDTEFRTFLGFPSNFMDLKARAYSVVPEAIDHGEAGDGEEDGDEASSSEEESQAELSKPPTLVAPPEETKQAPAVPARPKVGAKSGAENTSSSAAPQQTITPPKDEDGIAMFDYAGAEAGELAFTSGEIVHMIESNAPQDWAAGYTDKSTADRPGYFPRSFVRPFTSEDYIYNSTFRTWSLRDDISDFTYDPSKLSYNYNKPPRAPATSLYK